MCRFVMAEKQGFGYPWLSKKIPDVIYLLFMREKIHNFTDAMLPTLIVVQLSNDLVLVMRT